ncbi:MAG: hypothetical protein GMKNLPBB_00294 [Myxococcota bacterium]|nr:hypothetical protein [Myxococcota bacterium]
MGAKADFHAGLARGIRPAFPRGSRPCQFSANTPGPGEDKFRHFPKPGTREPTHPFFRNRPNRDGLRRRGAKDKSRA